MGLDGRGQNTVAAAGNGSNLVVSGLRPNNENDVLDDLVTGLAARLVSDANMC